MSKEDVKASGRRLVLLVLGVLSTSALHGYAIARQIREESGGVFQPGEGLLYPLLHQLEEEGAIQSHWEEVDGRRRKVYTLTPQGHRRLADERALFEAETRATRAILARTEAQSLALG
ncbi:MAG: helix-turn-helix transcriptional regulator [Actinomycetia bacterium]|nr:helix-turn-helix transcriptional regulator [Actinomycetes bacterium]